LWHGKKLSVDELCKQSHSRLEHQRQTRQELENQLQHAVEGRQSPADDEAAERLLMTRLRELGERVPGVTHYENLLVGWYQLRPADRKYLFREIDTFIEQQKKLQRAAAVIAVLSQSFPEQ